MTNLIKQIEQAEKRFDKSKTDWAYNLKTLQGMELGEKVNWQKLDNPSRLKARLERLGRFIEADAVGNLAPVD